jgi:hypothetical protein
MAGNQKSTQPDTGTQGGGEILGGENRQAPTLNDDGTVTLETPHGPIKIPPAARTGRPRKNFGKAAEKRREADSRYAARKAGIIPPAGKESAHLAAPPKSTAGYADELVIWHEEAAEIMGMPELRLKPARAQKLERAFTEVMNDRGVTLKSPRAHMMSLIFIVALIYVPMILAVMRKLARERASAAQASVVNQPMPAPSEPVVSAPGFETINPQGKPETEMQIFGNGKVAGAFFDTSGMQ